MMKIGISLNLLQLDLFKNISPSGQSGNWGFLALKSTKKLTRANDGILYVRIFRVSKSQSAKTTYILVHQTQSLTYAPKFRGFRSLIQMPVALIVAQPNSSNLANRMFRIFIGKSVRAKMFAYGMANVFVRQRFYVSLIPVKKLGERSPSFQCRCLSNGKDDKDQYSLRASLFVFYLAYVRSRSILFSLCNFLAFVIV